MDDLMCDDIRIGIAIRTEFSGWWVSKSNPGHQMWFCAGAIQQAGGLRKFLSEWERVEETKGPAK